MSFHSLNYMLTANQNSEQTKLLGYAKKKIVIKVNSQLFNLSRHI